MNIVDEYLRMVRKHNKGREEINMQGCTHNGGTTGRKILNCGKVCDPGQTLCPHHILLTQAQADEATRKEREKNQIKKYRHIVRR